MTVSNHKPTTMRLEFAMSAIPPKILELYPQPR